MNAAVAVALVAAALQIATTGAVLLMARAPGWERVRSFALVAGSAALYNLMDVWAVMAPRTAAELGWVIRINAMVASIHVTGWLLYTFGDASGSLRRLPRWLRRLAIFDLVVAAAAATSGVIIGDGTPVRMLVPALGVDYTQPQFSLAGDVLAGFFLITLGVCVAEHFRRARRGTPGAVGVLIGFALFFACSVEEVLVTAGVVNFIFLADVGFLCVVIPVTLQLGRRFIADARRLDEMSARLAGEVQERTSERDAAREALIEQERLAALGRLAAGVGHEINNPLQYLYFSLEELRDTRGEPEQLRDGDPLLSALDAADRIRRVVDGLRTYSRGDAETYATVDLREVVRHALRVAAPQLRLVAKVETSFGDVPRVLGDEARLVQVVVNPLVNAAQVLAAAGTEAPAIRIVTRTTADGSAEIEITDSGPGIPEHVLPRLGEPYVTTKAKTGGTGLGLFVSRGIMDAHQGTLAFDNAPGGGARVRIQLPARQGMTPPRATVVVPDTLPESAAAGHRVLLVDDEPQVLAVLSRGLRVRGYRVTCAADGTEALAKLRETPVDIIVSDLMMPRMSGIELADAVEDTYPELRKRFIVMTGGATTPAAEAFVQRTDVIVFSKPVGLTPLCEAIDRAALIPA